MASKKRSRSTGYKEQSPVQRMFQLNRSTGSTTRRGSKPRFKVKDGKVRLTKHAK